MLIDTRHTKILDLEDFLSRVFFKRPLVVPKAERILLKIAKGQLTADSWEQVVKELGIQQSTYYYILRRLRAAGLVEKVEGTYRLSKRFSKACEELAEFWSEWTERARRGS